MDTNEAYITTSRVPVNVNEAYATTTHLDTNQAYDTTDTNQAYDIVKAEEHIYAALKDESHKEDYDYISNIST